MLGLLELAHLGTKELISLANSGEIRMRNVWVALKGANKYRVAVSKGDLRPVDKANACARACAGCPSRTTRPATVNGLEVTVGYCGPMLEEVAANPSKGIQPTCGCLVTITFAGDLHPAGKSVVGSERCPQEQWPD